MPELQSNEQILQVCAALVPSGLLEPPERDLVAGLAAVDQLLLNSVVEEIRQGSDILGSSYMRLNAPQARRLHGETYTPEAIVESMVATARSMGKPTRVVDAGCGSGRFAIACAAAFSQAQVVAVDASPVATLMAKANVCALGLENQVSVVLGDFTTVDLPAPRTAGPTLWIGNPPYVRHHDISPEGKEWFAHTARSMGLKASKLSGLHAYFLLTIAQRQEAGDFGVLVTSAEWLDVKYGRLMRDLLAVPLGLRSLELYDKDKQAFEGTDTTSVVFAFDTRLAGHEGRQVCLSFLGSDRAPKEVDIAQLSQSNRWTALLAEDGAKPVPKGYVRLGDFARVHRGIVTGANKFWVRKAASEVEGLATVPVVSHAKEIMTGSPTLEAEGLSRLIALPSDLDALDKPESERAKDLLREGEALGVDKGYVARSRKCWWSIPVGEGATILMTYMARKAPVFVANPQRVRSLNVVHGIYPFVDLSERAVEGLVEYLNTSVSQDEGRTYCGGLTKFEPKEVEQLWVPSPAMLEEGSWRS